MMPRTCPNCQYCCDVELGHTWVKGRAGELGKVDTVKWSCGWNFLFEEREQTVDRFEHCGCSCFQPAEQPDAEVKSEGPESGACTMDRSFIEPRELYVQEFMCSECGEFTLVEIVGDPNEAPAYCQNCGARRVDGAIGGRVHER